MNLTTIAGVEVATEPDVWDVLDRRPDKYVEGVLVKQGAPIPKLRNAYLILAFDSRWRGRIRRNDFRGVVELDGSDITDDDESKVAMWLDEYYGLTVATNTAGEAVRSVAAANAYHPVREYLGSLTWDGKPRIGSLLDGYLGAGASPLNSEISRRWFISCVARVFQPGCKVDTVLILVGPQGAYKSTAFAVLAGRPWFSDTALDIRNKDSYQSLPGVWIYEMAELDAVKPREASTVKAFLSAPVDKYRPAYGRNTIVQKRQVVFVGTTNEREFLSDKSGDRRFWPIEVAGKIRIDAIREDRDQLWAEAHAAYSAGESWWLSQAVEADRVQQAEQFRMVDPWEEQIEAWTRGRGAGVGVTVAELLEELAVPVERQNKGMAMRVAGILTGLGYLKRRVRQDSQRLTKWYPAALGD